MFLRASKPTYSHSCPCGIRALPTKINEVLISVAHPGTPINVIEAQVWVVPILGLLSHILLSRPINVS